MQTGEIAMKENNTSNKKKTNYYIVKEKALPEVLLKVAKVKKMLERDPKLSIIAAVEMEGISRSSFYKYKDDIMEFNDTAKGRTITFVMQMADSPGLLSEVLKLIAGYGANVLTIHQSVPVNGVATLTISIEVPADTGDVSTLIVEIEHLESVHYVKVVSRE